MTISDIKRDITLLERKSVGHTGAGAARLKIEGDFDKATADKLTAAFPDIAEMQAFAAAMPDKPDLKAITAAFPDGKKLGAFINDALGGDPTLLGVLADKGCGRDLSKLNDLAVAFEGEPEKLKAFVMQGGLAAQPDALAAIFQDGCAADPAELKTLMAKYPDETKLGELSNALGAGGLGQSPDALAALAKEDGGTLLATLTSTITNPADLKKLDAMVNLGGLNGEAVARPEMLRDMLVDGLDSDPNNLLMMYDKFGGTAPGAMDQMGRLMVGLDGTDGLGGERLGTVLGGLKVRNGNSMATAMEKLKDPFMTTMDSGTSNSARIDSTAAAGDHASSAIAARPAPPAAVAGATLEAAIDKEKAVALLLMGADISDAAAIAKAFDATARTDARVAGLGTAPLPLDASPHDLAALTTEVKTKTDAVTTQPAGASDTDIAALEVLIDPLLSAAAVEPNDGLKQAALAQATAASKAIAQALSRRAAALITGGGAAGDAALALSVSQDRATTTEAKAYLAAAAEAANQAAVISAGAGADPKTLADKARAALSGDGAAENKAVTDATAKATAMKNTVDAARAPVDPALLAHAATVANDTLETTKAAPDQTLVTTALAAVKALTDAIALAARKAAAAQDTQTLLGFAEGKAAVAAAAAADGCISLLTRAPADATKIAAQGKARDAALAGALTIKDADSFAALSGPDQKSAAEDALRRKVADGKAGAVDSGALTTARTAANKAAEDAATAADTARGNIAGTDYDISAPDSFDVRIEKTTIAAQAAFEAAAMAPDDAKRALALTAAKAAAAAASDAAKRFAAHAVAAKATETRVDQRAKASAAVAPKNAFVAGGGGTAGPAAKAMDKALIAITENAAAVVAKLATEAPVVTEMASAAEAQIKADAPGANHLVKIEALEARRDADKALAIKAGTEFTTALGAAALTAVIAGGDAQPTKDTKCADGLAAAETAMSGGRVALSSIMAFLESSRAVAPAIAQALKTLNAIDVGQRSASEISQITHLSARATDPASEVTAAEGMRAALGANQNDLATKIKQCLKNMRASGAPTVDALSMTAGLAQYTVLEKDKGTSKSLSAANVIENAARMTGDPLPAAVNAARPARTKPNPTPPPPDVPVPGETIELDMEHYAERHLRDTFELDDAETQATLMVGAAVKAEHFGTATPAGRATQLEAAYGKAKKTTFFPNGITQTQLIAIGTQAADLVKTAIAPNSIADVLVAQIGVTATTWSKAYEQYDNLAPAGPPPGIIVKVGYELTADPVGGAPYAPARMRQLFPESGPGVITLTASDIKTIATALGR